jgi:molybdate transport repressor ModE-like protein
MHTSFTVEFDHAWLAGRGLPRERGRALLKLLAKLAEAESLRAAATEAGLSYRSAWDALADGARLFGAPLVDMQRGRRARLSALGVRVLEADERVRGALGGHFERLRAEIPAFLADALPNARPRLTIHASHDLALAELGALCRGTLDLEVVIRGADDCLAALARGDCDVAGFHVADALPRAAAAPAPRGRGLGTRQHTRRQLGTPERGRNAAPRGRNRGRDDRAPPGGRVKPPP